MNSFKYKILIIVISLSSCSEKLSETDLLNKTNPEGIYGKKINLETKSQIATLLETPQTYLGKDVLVTGQITEVCPMRGCWIDVKDLNTSSNIRIKVTDGKIVFPLSSKGKYVDIQGVFTKLEFTEGQAKNWKIHLAEEQGLSLNHEDIEISPEDLIEYRINGQGAIIYTYGEK